MIELKIHALVMDKVVLDLVDPLLVPSILFFEALVILIEALVIFFLLERNLSKALAASFVANLLTGLLSLLFFLFPFNAEYQSLVLVIVFSLIVNILLEAGVLRLLYKTVSLGRVFKTSTIMNVASYAIVILNFLYIFG